ncbi:site-2 protease family protein [Salinirubellus salinus]|uniref:Site-2 protease family protein n=1 Tax=Salinirubellus salinus TaxID=1364945 RepID=A0A9E7R674_9EURY|nr:site-2 protease family protein [Salinirubellus salinus]UWM55448.1 site-2 protease family protein [Salinirubellus salinus]
MSLHDSPAVAVLLGLLVFGVVAELLDRSERLPPGVSATGPFLTLSSTRGRTLLDRVARPRWLWRLLGTAGLAIVAGLVVLAAVGVVLAGVAAVLDPASSPIESPGSVLVVPGVNPFLPLAAAPELLFGVLLGLVVHEGAHGVLARAGDIEVESVGLFLLAVVPAGAYVLPAGLDGGDEADSDHERGHRLGWARLYAAGPAANLVGAGVCFLALLVVLGSVAPVAGVAVGGVFADSPAADAGLERGDVLTSLGGRAVGDDDSLHAALANASGTVRVGRRDAPAVTVERSVTVVATSEASDLEPGVRILAVDGRNVSTVAAFREALADDRRAELTLEAPDGSPGGYALKPGLAGRVAPDGPLDEAGAAPDGRVVLVRVAGERVLDRADLGRALADRQPGETVTVEAFEEGDLDTFELTLGGEGDRREPSEASGESDPILGIFPEPGVSGLVLTDFGVEPYPADTYHGALRGAGLPGAADGPLQRGFAFLLLPLAGVVGLAPFGFAGFVGTAREAFVVSGVLAPLGDGAFVLANALFWSAWLQIQLAAFNCIPAYPLDGGRLVRSGVAALGERQGWPDPAERAEWVAIGLTMAMLGVLVVILAVSLLL